ncbi:stage II sporulation protein R [Pseudoneobacillus sp. C159]
MMKKSLGLAYILVLAIGTILSLYIPKNEVTANEAVVIPKEAIRLRILANSDSEADQALKRKVRDEVNANITTWVQELTSIREARGLLQEKQPEIQAIAEAVVKREGSTQTVHVEFGKVQFPTKLYGQFLYPAGEYEAILITLGKGKGANWWCVLFPPLCFLDFSNGVAVSDGFEGPAVASAKEVAPTSEASVENVEPAVIPEKVETAVISEKEEPIVIPEKKVDDRVQVEKPLAQVEPVQTEQLVEKDPVFVAEEEQRVEVKFFLKELWLKIF